MFNSSGGRIPTGYNVPPSSIVLVRDHLGWRHEPALLTRHLDHSAEHLAVVVALGKTIPIVPKHGG